MPAHSAAFFSGLCWFCGECSQAQLGEPSSTRRARVSLRLPAVLIARWSRVSPRGPAHVCHKGTVPPPRHGLSRSVPPASVSQGPVGACSAPPRVVSPSGGRCRRGQGPPPWSPSTAAPCVSLRQALGCCVAGLSPRPWGSRARSGSPPRSCHQTPPPPRPPHHQGVAPRGLLPPQAVDA